MMHLFLAVLMLGSQGGDTWTVASYRPGYLARQPAEALELSDGRIVVSMTEAMGEPYLLCLERDGSVSWHRNLLEFYGGERALESGGYLAPLEGGFAVCFYSEPRATGMDTDVAVAALSESGEILWEHLLGMDSDSVWSATDLVPCSDGGVLVVGSPGYMLPDGYLLKLSASGERQWMLPPGELEAYPVTACEEDDWSFSVLLVFGEDYESGLATVDFGELYSVSELPSELSLDFSSFMQNGYLVSKDRDRILLSNYSGETAAEIRLSEGCHASGTDMVGSSVAAAGSTDEDRAFVGLYQSDGEMLWERFYGGDHPVGFEGVLALRDGFFCLGWMRCSEGTSQVLLVKIDSEGMLDGCSETADGSLWMEPDSLGVPMRSEGWVIACGTYCAQDAAEERSWELARQTGLETGHLWIPDWQSLSGSSEWLVFARPYTTGGQSRERALVDLGQMVPDAYMIWVSQGWDRRAMALEEYLDLL